MPLWNTNDREESKPTWLNKIQKRLCIRTLRGWEMPLMGSFFGYGATGYTSANNNDIGGVVYTELLVSNPIDDSTSASYTARGNSGSSFSGMGVTSGSDTPNFAPYFTCPFTNDSVTAGGADGAGVSHSNITFLPINITGVWGTEGFTAGPWGAAGGGGIQYGVNKYGVSSLGGLTGVTAYIKVVANDSNLTNTLTIGLSGTYSGINLYTGRTDLNDQTKVPAVVFNAFFGATSTDDKVSPYRYDNIGVLAVGGHTANGRLNINMRVQDILRGSVGSTGFSSFKLCFDRAAGTYWTNTDSF